MYKGIAGNLIGQVSHYMNSPAPVDTRVVKEMGEDLPPAIHSDVDMASMTTRIFHVVLETRGIDLGAIMGGLLLGRSEC